MNHEDETAIISIQDEQVSFGRDEYWNNPLSTEVSTEELTKQSLKAFMKCLKPVSFPRSPPKIRTAEEISIGEESLYLSMISEWFNWKGNKVRLSTYDTPEHYYVHCLLSWLQKIQSSKPRFRGHPVGIGSYFEHTKINEDGDVDYLWEVESLVLNVNFRVEFQPPVGERSMRSLFKVIAIQDEATWGPGILDASEVQSHFKQVLSDTFGDILEFPNPYMTQNGPANALKLEIHTTTFGKLCQKKSFVKVDITFAIPIDLPLRRNGDWYEVCMPGSTEWEEIQINPAVNRDYIRVHLVPYQRGELWRLSFAQTETELLAAVPDRHKVCLTALKFLKGVNSVTNEDERTSLSSYPLKIAFLREHSGDPSDDNWQVSKLSERAASIMANLSRDKATSFLLKDEPLFPEHDRSFLEIMRLNDYLKQKLVRRGSWRMRLCVLELFLVFCLAILVFDIFPYPNCFTKYVTQCIVILLCTALTLYIAVYFAEYGALPMKRTEICQNYGLIVRALFRMLSRHDLRFIGLYKCLLLASLIQLVAFGLLGCVTVTYFVIITGCSEYIRFHPFVPGRYNQSSCERLCEGFPP